MRTQEEFKDLTTALEKEGLSLSGPRAHSARRNFESGEELTKVVQQAVAHETQARESWIQIALEPWCKRHGLTREQGLSIAFDDDAFNPKNPQKDLVTLKSLFAWGGQQNDFAYFLMRQAKAMPAADPVELAEGEVKIKVAVLCSDANGAPDLPIYEIKCTKDEYDNGDHYAMAVRLAAEEGYDGRTNAFDEKDPAWKKLVPQTKSIYQGFFEEAVVAGQDAFIPGKEAGSEVLSNLAGLFERYLNSALPDAGQSTLLYFAHGPEGFLSFNNGYEDNFADASFTLVKDEITSFVDSTGLNDVTVVGLTLGQISGVENLTQTDLCLCAQDALARSKKYEFSVSKENAAEVMREETDGDSLELPREFDPILEACVAHEQERARLRIAERGG